MQQPFESSKHIVMVAGEESGDQHAATLIRELQERSPEIKISGIGGTHMRQAGAHLIHDLARYGVTGFSEVFRYFRIIKKAMQQIKVHLTEQQPDLLVLIDYPGFNLRLARFAKQQLGLKVIYYISPQIWAWKANRIHIIKKYIDHMAVILPFEKAIYEKAHVPVTYVGHPLVAKISEFKSDSLILRQELNLPIDKKIVALLPGSRRHEIERHMPVIIETVQCLLKEQPNIHFVVPVAHTILPEVITNYVRGLEKYFTILSGKTWELISISDCTIVASGTASLECALLAKPMCIIYKASYLTAMIASQVIRVKYLGLCNLLMNTMTVPEILQDDYNSIELSRIVHKLLYDDAYRAQMSQKLTHLRESLSVHQADIQLADLLLEFIAKKQ